MRCSCTQCGTYMIHAESMRLGCVCPDCLNRCNACLGTNSVIGRDDLDRLRETARAIDLREAEPDALPPTDAMDDDASDPYID